MTYFDGSTSFQIIFDLGQRIYIQAVIPFTLNFIEVYVDIRYGSLFYLFSYNLLIK